MRLSKLYPRLLKSLRWHSRWFLSCGVILACSNALAHHGYSLNYDTTSTIMIEGVVKEVLWANPHVHLYLSVVNAQGESELWDVETHHLGLLANAGWKRTTVTVGELLKVSGNPGRRGNRIAGRDFEKADGSVISVGVELGERRQPQSTAP